MSDWASAYEQRYTNELLNKQIKLEKQGLANQFNITRLEGKAQYYEQERAGAGREVQLGAEGAGAGALSLGKVKSTIGSVNKVAEGTRDFLHLRSGQGRRVFLKDGSSKVVRNGDRVIRDSDGRITRTEKSWEIPDELGEGETSIEVKGLKPSKLWLGDRVGIRAQKAQARIKGIVDRGAEKFRALKEQGENIRDDISGKIGDVRSAVEDVKGEAVGRIDDVKGQINSAKGSLEGLRDDAETRIRGLKGDVGDILESKVNEMTDGIDPSRVRGAYDDIRADIVGRRAELGGRDLPPEEFIERMRAAGRARSQLGAQVENEMASTPSADDHALSGEMETFEIETPQPTDLIGRARAYGSRLGAKGSRMIGDLQEFGEETGTALKQKGVNIARNIVGRTGEEVGDIGEGLAEAGAEAAVGGEEALAGIDVAAAATAAIPVIGEVALLGSAVASAGFAGYETYKAIKDWDAAMNAQQQADNLRNSINNGAVDFGDSIGKSIAVPTQQTSSSRNFT